LKNVCCCNNVDNLPFVWFQAHQHREDACSDANNIATSTNEAFPLLHSQSQSASSMKDGSDFHVIGELTNPQEIIKRAPDFESVIVVLQQIKIDESFSPESHVTDEQRQRIAQRDAEVKEMRDKMAQMTEENAQNYLAVECCNLLRDIGPPWNWLHNFASQSCREMSYNFLESIKSDVTGNEQQSSDESFDYLNEKFIDGRAADESKSVSGASGVSFTVNEPDDDDEASSTHKVLVDVVCSISEAADKGQCSIKDTTSLASFLDDPAQFPHDLNDDDHERLKGFIRRAEDLGIVFNDLNELYNYFVQEATREPQSVGVAIREEDEYEAEAENLIGSVEEAREKADGKNVVSIFGESGIEVDGRLLDAKVSERMILGLVDKPTFEDNVSDVASSVSSLSQAETVRLKQNVTREKDTQTLLYRDQIHSKRVQSKQVGKSKSASSIKRQPFTCKIPQIPGIGPSMEAERMEKILRFITHRSFQQGGLVYPRNLVEDECPSMMLE